MAEPTRKPRVLVVDDDAAVRELITVNLELEGFEVASAEDGVAALSAIDAFGPDLVTLDVRMSRLGGFETLERLRADPRTASVPVVMVTRRTQAADRARAEELGVTAYVTKPFEPGELVEVISRLTGRE
jgi:DNA-binding response OmpR family regulator